MSLDHQAAGHQILSSGKMYPDRWNLLVWYSAFTAIPAVPNLDMSRDKRLPHSRQFQVQHFGDTVSEFSW